MRRAVCFAFAAASLFAAHVSAHEVRPAYLEITPAALETPASTAPATTAQAASQTEATAADTAMERYDVLWKQPLLGDRRLPLEPLFADNCVMRESLPESVGGSALVLRTTLDCTAPGLLGTSIRIGGLNRTLTDVLVRVTPQNGELQSAVLNPSSPEMTVSATPTNHLWDYLKLGVEHLLFGFDHILFVLTLIYLTRDWRSLVKTITAFTVAHSLTLGITALELIRLPQTPVEAIIALSILLISVECLRRPATTSGLVPSSSAAAPTTLTQRFPWAVAFGFGLIHGCGFAGALADIGLPEDSLLLALLLFNVGLELGQLLVIGAALLLVWLLRNIRIPAWITRAPLYATGSIAAYWLIGRTLLLL